MPHAAGIEPKKNQSPHVAPFAADTTVIGVEYDVVSGREWRSGSLFVLALSTLNKISDMEASLDKHAYCPGLDLGIPARICCVRIRVKRTREAS